MRTATISSSATVGRWENQLFVRQATVVHHPSGLPPSSKHRRQGLTTRAVIDHSQNGAKKYYWDFSKQNPGKKNVRGVVRELPVDQIRRPLARTRANDPEKVAALMESIKDIGLQEPIDVLEVEGQYFGFSGCHRYEAHQRLGLPTILCRIRKGNRHTLKMHMM